MKVPPGLRLSRKRENLYYGSQVRRCSCNKQYATEGKKIIVSGKIHSTLKNTTQGKKALLIEGARRIGKSTIAEEFARHEYRSYILIDFNDVSDAVINAFNNLLGDLDTFFMDFEEFCDALGESMLVKYIKNCFAKKIPLERGLHEKAMLIFKEYILVGGMPQSVAAFLEKRSFQRSDEEKRDILKLYRDDIMKIEDRYQSRVLAIFDQVPAFLSQHDHNRQQQGELQDFPH